MRLPLMGWMTLMLVASGSVQAVSPPQQPSSSSAATSPSPSIRAVLDRYCVTCHNTRSQTAGLALDAADVSRVAAGAEVWEKVVRKLRTGDMPPAGRPSPDPATAHAVASWLETELDRAAVEKPMPGT